MSEEKTDGGQSQGFTPPASQEELNRIIDKRLERERAKFADYEDLKAKAARVEAAEDALKQAQQVADEKVQSLTGQLTRAQIQAKYKISDDDAELFLTASDAERLEAQAKALSARDADRKSKGPYVPAQKGGESGGQVKPDPLRDLARKVFKTDE